MGNSKREAIKKIILMVLIAGMFATPCMAEVEPEGVFWIEETYWSATSNPPYLNANWGFSGDKVYMCSNAVDCSDVSIYGGWGIYADLLLFTIVNVSMETDLFKASFTACLIPLLGFGVGCGNYIGWGVSNKSIWLTFTKLNDNWTPPSD